MELIPTAEEQCIASVVDLAKIHLFRPSHDALEETVMVDLSRKHYFLWRSKKGKVIDIYSLACGPIYLDAVCSLHATRCSPVMGRRDAGY